MARTINMLSDGNALLRFSSSDGSEIGISSVEYDWTAENATLTLTSTEYAVNSRYVMQIFPSSASGVVLELSNIPLSISDNGRALSANLKMKAAAPISISSLLYIDSASASYTPHSQELTSGLYNAVHTNQVSVPEDESVHTATIRLVISGYGSSNIFVTLPHLIHELAFYENPFVPRSRTFLPDFYFEIDSTQTNPSFPFFRLIDILTSAAGETAIEHDRMYGIESGQLSDPNQTVEFWAKSSLVSPQGVRNNYIPWLSQFTGNQIKQNIQKSDGSLFFTNEQTRRDFVEWQLTYGHLGRAAGSREAIAESVRQILIYTKDGTPSSKTVAVTPRYLDDPFSIKVTTLTNETPDASNGEESYLAMQAIMWAKPMGYTVYQTTVDTLFFSFDDPTLGVLDTMRFG